MKRIRVSSSTIRSVGYDSDSMELEIEFTSGTLYQYQGMLGPEYKAFMSAESKDTYFNTHIRDQYPTVKL